MRNGLFNFSENFLNPDFTDFDRVMEQNKELAEKIAIERIQKEMLQYAVLLVNQECHGKTTEDAYSRWESYKKRKGIEIDAAQARGILFKV